MSSATPPAATSALRSNVTTTVGVDVGVKQLAAVAPDHAGPAEAYVVDGEPIREQYDHLVQAVKALEWTHDEQAGVAEVFVAFYHRIRAQLHCAAVRVVQYAREFPAPVVALEDIAYAERPLWTLRDGGELGSWLLPAFQAALTERAVDAGIPVVEVDAEGTTRECHHCGRVGDLDRETLHCSDPDCPVDTVCRDRSAAVTIAHRGATALGGVPGGD